MKKVKDHKIVYVDLSQKKILSEDILPEIRKKYLGGTGINTKILYESEAMHHDALSEKNVLIFGVGPAVGTGLLAGNRCTITAKSPLTDLFGDSNIGGDFTLNMRSVGIDHLVFTGKAESPVYVFISKDGEIQIIDATDLWGTWTEKVTDILMERHGKNCEVACIGPAGENLVRFACVIMSKCHAAGRMGLGCVMGSKNLKAVVIEGNKCTPPIYDKEKINQIRKIWMENCRTSVVSKMGNVNGTLFLLETYDKDKHIPIRNCKAGYDEKTKNIYVAQFKADHLVKKKACYACPVACSKAYEIREGKYQGEKGERIDYGTVAGLGTSLGVFDWASIIHLKLLADNLGIDTIEVGGPIGLIMECQERGILKNKDAGGKVYKFGNTDDIEELMIKLVNREGVGDVLAEGAYRAAKHFHVEDYTFCVNKSYTGTHSKDRLAWSLGYLTSTRGGDHLKDFPFTMLSGGYFAQIVAKHIFKVDAKKEIATPDKKGRVVWWHENYKYVVDALGICIFAIHGLPNTGHAFFQDFANIMNALYNLEMTDEEVFYAAERMYQLQNAFNVNCGLKLENYKWPNRKKDKDIDDTYIDHTTIEVRDAPGMLPEYFEFRGLTSEGKPTASRFSELGLDTYGASAKAVQGVKAMTIKESLQDVALNVKFTLGERFKSFLLSTLLRRLLDVKDKKDIKKYLEQKKNLSNNK